MKKFNQMFTRRMKAVAWIAITIIALMITLTNPIAGAMFAFAVMVGEIELTGKEEALYNAVIGRIEKEVGKFEKGYISEQKMLDHVAAEVKKLNVNLEDNEEFKTLKESLKKQGLEMVAMKERGNQSELKGTTVRDAITKGFTEDNVKKETLEIITRKAGLVEVVTIKAVALMNTGSVTTTTGGNPLLDLVNSAERSIARLAATFVEAYATVIKTDKPVVTYADYIPKEGDVDFVGESGAKPMVDGKIEVRYATPKKAAGHEIMTTEAVQDIPQMESFASTLLFKKYLLRRQNGILFGDGIGDNPTGVTTIAALFNAASWTGEKIVAPNLLDVLRAIANQIYITQSWTDDVEYMPNVAYVNPADWFAFIGTKSNDAMYVFPQLTFGDNNSIDNFTVIPKAKIPAGKVLMGDFSKLVIAEYIPYSVKMGYINEQFTHNQFTLVGEGRFFTYVKEYDKRAFVYDTIENVKTGIKLV